MEKRIIMPGEKIAEGIVRVPNTYVEGDATYAAVIGTLDDSGKYIPLENRYRPSMGDVIVGMVTDVRHAGYEVDVNLPEGGFISTRVIKIKLEFGDFVICKVREVTETGDVELSEVRRLPKGKVVQFPTAKIPRLIGRKSSMIEMLKQYSGGDIVVGNNGMVWLSEKCDIPLLLKSMNMIDENAHTSGLTDRMKEFLEANGTRTVPEQIEEEHIDEGEMNG